MRNKKQKNRMMKMSMEKISFLKNNSKNKLLFKPKLNKLRLMVKKVSLREIAGCKKVIHRHFREKMI